MMQTCYLSNTQYAVWTSCYLLHVSLHDKFQLVVHFFSFDLISMSSSFVQVGISCILYTGMHDVLKLLPLLHQILLLISCSMLEDKTASLSVHDFLAVLFHV